MAFPRVRFWDSRCLRTLRGSLIWMVVGCVLPAWIGIAGLIYSMYASEHERAAQNEVMTARALVLALDRYLATAQTAMEVLAKSPELETDDFAAFHRRASELIRQLPGNNIVLRDQSGQQLVNTLKPFGQELPLDPNSGVLAQVFSTGKSAISNLFFGPVAKKHLIAIEVPVFRDGKVKYCLAIAVFAERIGDLLSDQKLPPGWLATIFDTSGTIVARTQNQDRFVGQLGSLDLREMITRQPSGFLYSISREGIPLYSGFSRSAVSNWAVAVGVPVAVMDHELYAFLGLSGAGALVILGFGIGLTGVKSRQIASEVKALIAPAMAFGRGEAPIIRRLRIREINDVASQLEKAFGLLQLRTLERDQAENERMAAKRTAELKDEFIATVSHELRTPLTSIAVSLELLADQEDADRSKPTSELLAIARTNSERLGRLVNDILDIEKLEAGKVPFDMQRVDVGTLLQQVLDANRPLVESFGVTLRFENTSRNDVYADPDRLIQVATNLLSNACKFSPAGAEVVVRAEDRGDKIRISVRDHGPGIPEGFRHRVFEKFAQADNSDARQNPGTGLGLSIVKQIVQRLAGEIAFTDAPGGGTIFFFDLPAIEGAGDNDALSAILRNRVSASRLCESEAA